MCFLVLFVWCDLAGAQTSRALLVAHCCVVALLLLVHLCFVAARPSLLCCCSSIFALLLLVHLCCVFGPTKLFEWMLSCFREKSLPRKSRLKSMWKCLQKLDKASMSCLKQLYVRCWKFVTFTPEAEVRTSREALQLWKSLQRRRRAVHVSCYKSRCGRESPHSWFSRPAGVLLLNGLVAHPCLCRYSEIRWRLRCASDC